MTDNPDPEDLARLYMEFWRKNMAGLTRDPQVAEGIARLFEMMTAGASTFAGMMAARQHGAGGQAKGTKSRPKSADAEIEARFDQLTRRVAELERRIARLEPRARVRRAPARPRRPRR